MPRWDVRAGDQVVGHVAVLGENRIEIHLVGSVYMGPEDASMLRTVLGIAIGCAHPPVEPAEREPVDPREVAEALQLHGLGHLVGSDGLPLAWDAAYGPRPAATLVTDEGITDIGPDGFPA